MDTENINKLLSIQQQLANIRKGYDEQLSVCAHITSAMENITEEIKILESHPHAGYDRAAKVIEK